MRKEHNIKTDERLPPKGGNMQRAEATDLYEAAYLVVQGGRIEGVQCIPLSSSLGCTFTISGEGITAEQEEYQQKRAEVNLYAFRLAYTQVNGLMREAKKAWERERRALRKGGIL
jgi:hypothetical protein